MSRPAQVNSIDALDQFRARLIVFLEKSKVAVDDVIDDVARTRRWLATDQRQFWDMQVRRRAKQLEMVEQELFTAQLGSLGEPTHAKLMAVKKAKQALEEAQTRLAMVKKWDRDYEGIVGPWIKQVEKLRASLSTDLPPAVALLTRAVETLDAYAERSVPAPGAPSAPAPETTPAAPPAPETGGAA